MAYLNFFAPINQNTVNSFMDDVCRTKGALEIRFASGGGDITTGFIMYNYLRSLNRPITMHCFGDVYSIAVITYLAGDIRLATSNSVFRIHRLACEHEGGASLKELKDQIKSLELDIQRYNDVFLSRTSSANAKCSKIDILDALCGGNVIHMSATDALSAGIITAIVDI